MTRGYWVLWVPILFWGFPYDIYSIMGPRTLGFSGKKPPKSEKKVGDVAYGGGDPHVNNNTRESCPSQSGLGVQGLGFGVYRILRLRV